MEKLKIGAKEMDINIQAFSKSLYDLHAEDKSKLQVLSFGMLDAKIIEEFERQYKETIEEYFKEFNDLSHTDIIKTFIKRTKREIIKGVYKHAKMVV